MAHAITQVNRVLARKIDGLVRAVSADVARARRGDETAVHDTRVAARRLREALAIAEAVTPRGEAGRAGRELRRLRRALGPVREADIVRHLVGVERDRHAWAPAALAALSSALDAERDTRVRQMSRTLGRLRTTRLRERIHGAAEALRALPDDRVIRQAMSARARRRASELSRAVARVGTLYDPSRLHAVRLAAKKLRYVAELAVATVDVDLDASLARLRHVQDALGHLNDVRVLSTVTRAVATELVGEDAQADAVMGVSVDLEVDCRRLHAALVKEVAALRSLASEISQILVPALALRPTRMLKMPASGHGSHTEARRAAAGHRGA